MSVAYSLKVLRAEGLQLNHPLHSKSPDAYVKVRLGDITQRTRIIKKSTSPTWDESLALSSSDDSATLEITVKHNSTFPFNPSIGTASMKISDLLERCKGGETSLTLLSRSAATTTTTGTLFLRLCESDAMANVEEGVATAAEDVQESGFVRTANLADTSQTISDGFASLSKQGELYHAIRELLSRLEVLQGVMDGISEIHPFLTVAWSLVSGLYKAVDHTFQTDKKIVHLINSMQNAFAFVRERDTLRDKMESLQQSIEGLLKQTAECCTFVRQYARRDFLRRMLDIGASAKLDEFESALRQFKDEIDSGTILHTAVVSSRVLQGIGEVLDNQRLSRLRELLVPASFEAFHRPLCLPETRIGVREQIIEWVFSDTEQNIFWLHGVAGSGKSTVSTTVASKLRDMSRLGAFLFFERGKSEPSSVIRTIAYKLALFDSSIGSSILSEIENDKDILTASPAEQFTKLLLRPLDAASNLASGPIAIALDALDECGGPQARRVLLDLFRRDFPKLPKFIRILITSRREPDIDASLSSQPETVRVVELDSAAPSSQRDVLVYLRTEMDSALGEKKVEVAEDWSLEEKIEMLGTAANGLFIWASTAVKMVRDSSDPFYQLNLLVEDSGSLSGFGLDALYASVLQNSGVGWENERFKDRFRKILALVLFSKVPLSIKAIDDILGWKKHETSNLVLSNLRSLISYTEGGTVSLFHTSFSDYLLSEDRTKDPWSIDTPAAMHHIVERCFTIMADLLHFNICRLESSFIRNDDVPGLANRIKERIPPHLEYACLYWAQHLLDVPHSPGIHDMLSDFARRRLLFWFEVLSLVKAFHRTASRALLDASMWSETYNTDMAVFLRDASNLASTYAPAISHSTPHIYISMMPLAKDDSRVARHYLDQVAAMVRVERQGVKRHPVHLKVYEGHSYWVNSVAISPDGKRIASASADGSIRIWDVANGEEICAPLTKHSSNVLSVCFSPDGRRIVSGSLDFTIMVWDAETGELILGPLSGHDMVVWSVAYSPDGTLIASGSVDKTIILWDAVKGQPIVDALTGHTGEVMSVAFSPDGTRLVSGSDDTTIIIWDVQSGKSICELRGHSDWVWSVAFSPGGKHVVSGSRDNTIRIWDVESGDVVSTLSGHSLQVMSVAYSPCGTRIVSGSDDKTIVIWDAKTGQVTSGPFKGHSSTVRSVTWSRDGNHIASGSYDKTVRIWDATARVDNSEPLSGHIAAVMSVALSPDASRIASASVDKSILVWNGENGELVLGPLRGHSGWVGCVAYSLDGSQLISGSEDGTIRVWDAENGATILEPLRHTRAVRCIAMSPDGSMLASGSYDNTIRVWELTSGTLIAGPLHGHSDTIYSVAFSPDGKLLVSGSGDKTIRIWNTETWDCLSEPLTGHTDEVNSVCSSPDGTRMASGADDRTIIIWDMQSRQMIDDPLQGHTSFVMSIVFSLDGKYVISGSMDDTIRIWNVDSRSNTAILEGHTSNVMSLALSSDGSRLVSGSYDNTIRTWDVSHLFQLPDERPSNHAVDSLNGNEDLSDWVLKGGWILPGHDRRELVLWIPPDLRATLWRPRNTGVFSCEFSTRLDFDGAALGVRWTECFTTRQE